LYLDSSIERQNQHNAYIKEKIALDQQISEIKDLRAKREQLLARMQVIQELQGNRPVIVRVFDELVRTLAKGVFFSTAKLDGRNLAIEGISESNNRISSLMRNLEASDWFASPNLKAIKENTPPVRGEQFQLTKPRPTRIRSGKRREAEAMALQDTLEQLRSFDLGDLDVNNIGAWPGPVKVIILVLLLVLVLAGGYFFYLTDKQKVLTAAEQQEAGLRSEYEGKAFQAANLEAYRKQKEEMEATFGALLRQLPSDTEVPGLIEDITLAALEHKLSIESIDLQPERKAEFYVERVTITVEGATTTSARSSLRSRIVAHRGAARLCIRPEGTPANLKMSILAKTYRYMDDEKSDASRATCCSSSGRCSSAVRSGGQSVRRHQRIHGRGREQAKGCHRAAAGVSAVSGIFVWRE
jgi:type IV pilus assembly protein PilO